MPDDVKSSPPRNEHELELRLKELRCALAAGWHGFSGDIVLLPQASPKGVPFDYVMQPADLKLRYKNNPCVNLHKTKDICERLFAQRRRQPWPTNVTVRIGWDTIYDAQRRDLDVFPTIDEAVAWTNQLIGKIVNS